MMTTKKTKKNFTFAIGKRKSSSARIRLFRGKGENLINDKPLAEYFPGAVCENRYLSPFRLTDTSSKYYVTAKIFGGGKQSQLDAFVHGLARALASLDQENYKKILKKGGFLTRDPRERLRRMVGMGGKARRKKQSPKR